MKGILRASLGAAMIVLLFSSYKSGTWNGGAGNRTGSAGPGTATCTGSTCHAGHNGYTYISLVVLDSTNSPIYTYVPGITYTVRVGGVNTNQLRKFGFQATCVKKSATTIQAGSFASTASNISVRTNTNPNLVEHNTPNDITVGNGTDGYIADFNWTAPPAGTGPVLFYATLLAAGGSGGGSDEATLSYPTELSEATTGVSNLQLIPAQLFPNPAGTEIQAHVPGATGNTCSVQITDVTGKIVSSCEVHIVNGLVAVKTADLKTGSYFLRIQQGRLGYGAVFLKN